MTTEYDPSFTIPDIPAEIKQSVTRDWSLEEGEAKVTTYRGKYSVLESLYNNFVDAGLAGNPTIASVNITTSNGRASLQVRTVDQSYEGSGQPTDRVEGVEELYPVDITKDVAAHPKYVTLSISDVAKVKKAISELLTADEAYSYLDGDGLKYDLWKRYARGESSYLALSYVYRRTYVTNSSLKVIALIGTVNTKITQVALIETINTKIAAIIAAVPTNTWLVRTPKVTFQGRGKYHVEEEYQWADWSDLYDAPEEE